MADPPAPEAPATVRVNRAPVLTLWATVVAERLGHPPDTALSLGSALAGTAAQAKARRLGLAEPREESLGGDALPPRPFVALLGRELPVVAGPDGRLYADAKGTPSPADPVRRYLDRAFGPHLGAVRTAMEELAARLDPVALNRLGFHLYVRFRPEVPDGVTGWGSKGELRLDSIRDALRPGETG